MATNYIVFYPCRTEDADLIFQEAAQKNLTGQGYAWIVTEQALQAPNVPVGLYSWYLVSEGWLSGYVIVTSHGEFHKKKFRGFQCMAEGASMSFS